MSGQSFCRLAAALLTGLLAACGGDQEPENVFEAQTEAIGKAEDAAEALQDAAAAQRRAIEDQSH